MIDLANGRPLNFKKWIEENSHKLTPPVNNAQVWTDSDFMITVVGSPNERNDFHDNPTEEFFYQLKGNASAILWKDGKFDRVVFEEGDIFLMPPHQQHSPQRPEEGSLCLVIERKRPVGELDAVSWFCGACSNLIKRYEMDLDDITKDLPPVYEAFYETSQAERTCSKCGEIHPGRDYPAWHKQLAHGKSPI